MSPSSCCVWLLLANVALLLPCPASAETRMIDNFNSLGWLDNWSLVLGEEFPGAKGVLLADEGFQGSGASLRFDFSCFQAIGACNPRYIAASRQFETPIPGKVLSLWVRCDACEPLFRITDATGQRLIYGPVALPLAGDSFDAWHRVVLSLPVDIQKYQGGANDGAFHPGIREIRVIAQEDDILAPTGTLRFDQVRLHDLLADAFSQEVSLAFPTGSFRAPPSDSIARTSDILGGVKSNNVAEVAAAGFTIAWTCRGQASRKSSANTISTDTTRSSRKPRTAG